MNNVASPAIDPVELTLEQTQAAFASGAITSEALTQAFLDRIATYNTHYNALCFMNPDALDDARAIDRRRAAGDTLGPLAGVPVVVKDAMDMVGFPTTAGWRLLHSKTGGVDLMPATDAPVVARMRAAGAIILGKTNIPVLSHTGSHANDSWAGPTYNAAGRGFLPGGSSAGTATAVAASMAVLGLAEETGGSIQNPASAQALVGIKPTFALVPNAGGLHDGRPEDRGGHRPAAQGRLYRGAFGGRAEGRAHWALRSRLARSALIARGIATLSARATGDGGARRRAGRRSFPGHRFCRAAPDGDAADAFRRAWDGIDSLRSAGLSQASG